MIRVLVAEDSLTVRQLLVEILKSDPDIAVVGEAKSGDEAVELAERLKPDLITMDIQMPVMDGFAATKEIMTRCPTPIVIVSASTSNPDVERALNAMRAGALTVVDKPHDPLGAQFNGRRERLLATVKAMAQVKVVRRWSQRVTSKPGASRLSTLPERVNLVAIVASTGGPAVLHRTLSELPRDYPVPVLVVQHIAKGFVRGLADWLDTGCDLRVKVAEHGETLASRTVYVAPDDRHLVLAESGKLGLTSSPPVGGFRPSGTVLFESVAQAHGTALLAVILTGMGSDGVDGLKAAKASGAYVLAQDEASSAVFGMPHAAIDAGIVDEVVAADELSLRLAALAARGRHA